MNKFCQMFSEGLHSQNFTDGSRPLLRHPQQYFSYIVAVSFIGGGNQSKTLSPNVVSSTPRHERFTFWNNSFMQ